MKSRRHIVLTSLLLSLFTFPPVSLAQAVGGETAAAPDPKPDAVTAETATPEAETVAPPVEITSKSLEYDMKNHIAHLLGNVKVVDAQATMTADKMTLHLDKDNQAERIEANGHVRIVREGSSAESGKAVFEVKKGTITLTENPILHQGPSRISGAERVVYQRDAGKFHTEGGLIKMELFRDEKNKSTDELDIFGRKTGTDAK